MLSFVYVVKLPPGQREGTGVLEEEDATVLDDDEEVIASDVEVWLELDDIAVLLVDVGANELEKVVDIDWAVEKLSVVDLLLDVALDEIVVYTLGTADVGEAVLEVLLVATDVTLLTPVLVVVVVREIRLLELLNIVDVVVSMIIAPLLVRESEVVGREAGLRLRDDLMELVIDWLGVGEKPELDIAIGELTEYNGGTWEKTDVVNAVGGELLVDCMRLEETEVNPALVDGSPVADFDVEAKPVGTELVAEVDLNELVEVVLSPEG
jgi:hypothetical protein